MQTPAKKPQQLKRQDPSLPNRNTLIVGASGSGKSAFIRETVDLKAARVIAWDPDEDFRLPRVRSMRQFEREIKKAGFGPVRIALTVQPSEENFERFAQLVFAIAHAAAPMTVIADEIADVTRVAKATVHWGQLCRKCRKYGVTLYAITQRPQECDKTIFNQTKHKWCGALASAKSWAYMADELEIPVSELRNLENIERKQIQYWLRSGTAPAEKHTLKFTRKRVKK